MKEKLWILNINGDDVGVIDKPFIPKQQFEYMVGSSSPNHHWCHSYPKQREMQLFVKDVYSNCASIVTFSYLYDTNRKLEVKIKEYAVHNDKLNLIKTKMLVKPVIMKVNRNLLPDKETLDMDIIFDDIVDKECTKFDSLVTQFFIDMEMQTYKDIKFDWRITF